MYIAEVSRTHCTVCASDPERAMAVSIFQAHATNEWPIGDNLITGRTVMQATNLQDRLLEAEHFVNVSSNISSYYEYVINSVCMFVLLCV